MNEQLSIFDFLNPPEETDFTKMTTAEIAEVIGKRIGIEFKPTGWDDEHGAKVKKLKLTVHKSRYACDVNDDVGKGDWFIGVGYDLGTSGGGSPTDTIDDAVRYFEKRIEKYKKGEL